MTKGTRQGMIKRQPKKTEETKVNKQPKKYPDCTLCEHGNVGKYNLIHCKRPNNVAVPHPNCTVWKSNCIFYKKKEV